MNYDFKLATDGLSTAQKIKVNSKRLAFLVPNMFSRLKSGFTKKTKDMVSESGEEVGKVKTLVSSPAFAEVKEEAVAEATEITAAKIEEVQNKIDEVTAKREEIRADESIPLKESMCIIKAYQSDIDKLVSKKMKMSAAPKKLLISTIFVQKLIENRKKHKINDVEVEETQDNKIQKAMDKYIELNNKRLDYLEQLNEIQAEMKQLVTENGLTKEMFEEGKTR
ncbi:MAG TPA: hypothetical protein PLV83_01205 [Bacilli bacterium]|nr:hypothetical protein [Bacilli bacterium]